MLGVDPCTMHEARLSGVAWPRPEQALRVDEGALQDLENLEDRDFLRVSRQNAATPSAEAAWRPRSSLIATSRPSGA